MNLFSPVANRSWPARLLYSVVYALLGLGALTMVVPLLISLSGSMSGPFEAEPITFYPKFLVQERALWARFVEARYGGALDNLKMAWSEDGVDFYEPPPGRADDETLRRWRQFRAERGGTLTKNEAGLAFTRASKRNPALENRLFREWLLKEFGSLEGINAALSVEAPRLAVLLPPIQNRIVLPDLGTPYSQVFDQYLLTVPEDRRLIWDVGGFYRSVFLPRQFGGRIETYNAAAGTTYASFREVPFPATRPELGGDAWALFVRRVLNPAFVAFSPEGDAAWKQSGLAKVDFLRTRAEPPHLRVVSLDVDYAAWAAERGWPDARIPAKALDWEAFQGQKAFWRWQFTSQNFHSVIEQVLVQGNGVRNTIILVILSVVSALVVNPMAAYALSRFRPRMTYQVLLFFLATIAFPAEVAMIPSFLQIKELGMINTFGALVIPGMVNGFSIFLLKGFFDSLPKELYEAADIDGASEWQVFWGITMNLSKPILAVIALGAFTSAYGAFMFALILAPDPSMWTLMVWIYQLQQDAGQGVVYASVLLTAVPTLVVYLCAQNVILRGIIVPTEK